MSQHRRDEDDEHDGVPEDYASNVTERVTYWRYTLSPTLYVDENSSTSDLLWQQVLEQRAIRHWLIVLWMTIPLLGIIGAIVAWIVKS